MELFDYIVMFVVNVPFLALVVFATLFLYNAFYKKVFKKSIVQSYKDAINKWSKS